MLKVCRRNAVYKQARICSLEELILVPTFSLSFHEIFDILLKCIAQYKPNSEESLQTPLQVTKLTWQKLLGLISRCLVANPAIGGKRVIFDQCLMFVTSHIISALNHSVSANAVLQFATLNSHASDW